MNIGAIHVHQSQNWRTLLKAPATPSKTVAFKMSAGVSEREREKFLTAKCVLYFTVLYCTVQCYQVRGAPDGAHQEAAQGGDVDVRTSAETLLVRGSAKLRIQTMSAPVTHHLFILRPLVSRQRQY